MQHPITACASKLAVSKIVAMEFMEKWSQEGRYCQYRDCTD